MDIVCPICRDNVAARPHNLEVTCCGHLFHNDCLKKWIVSSPTCPHCRHKITEGSITRIYPSVAETNRDEGKTNTFLGATCGDYDIECRELRISYKEAEQKLTSATAALKKAVAEKDKIKQKLNAKTAEAAALKEQLDAAKQISSQNGALKEQNEKMRKNLEALVGLRHIFNATSAEVDDMMENCSDVLDVRTIATFTAALKRSLCETQNKNKVLCAELQSSKQQIVSLKASNEEVVADVRRLSADVHTLEEELASLKQPRELSASEKNVYTPGNALSLDSESDDEPYPPADKENTKYTAASPYLNLQSSSISFVNFQSSKSNKQRATLGNQPSTSGNQRLTSGNQPLMLGNQRSTSGNQPTTSSTQSSTSSTFFDTSKWLKESPVRKIPQYRNLSPRTNCRIIDIARKNIAKKIYATATQATNAAEQPSSAYDGLGGHSQIETVRRKIGTNILKCRGTTKTVMKPKVTKKN